MAIESGWRDHSREVPGLDFKAGLQRTVKAELERALSGELSGEETTKEVEETVHEIIDAELE